MGKPRLSNSEANARVRAVGLTPKGSYPGRVDAKWPVKCKACRHEYETTVDIVSMGRGCPKCGQRKRIAARTLGEAEARKRFRAAGLEPVEPYPGGSNKPWKARCRKCGSLTSPTPSRLLRQGGCRTCGTASSAVKRGIGAKEAEKRLRAAGLIPLEPYPGTTHKPWRSRCKKCGSTCAPAITALARQGGCKTCGHREQAQRRLDNGTKRAAQDMKRAGFTPLAPYPGAQRNWRARCNKCGKTSSPRLGDIRNGHGCAYCAGLAKKTEAEARRLAKKANREIIGDYNGWRRPVLMRCLKCGHESEHSPGMLVSVSGSCNNCKATRAIAPDEAVELMRAAGLEPLVPYPGARKPWPARCLTCGEKGQPQLGNIRQGQSGCRTCSNYGYDARKPTTLYVLVNREFRAVKVGITNTGSVRLRNLERGGWRPGRLFHFAEGRTPLHIETVILRRLRGDMGLKPAVQRHQMPGTGGATETFRLADISAAAIYKMVRSLSE